MIKKTSLALILCSNLLFATNLNKEDVKVDGEKIAKDLLKTLGSNMKKHMKQGGVMDAVNFCTINAYPLTQKVSDKYGDKISIKRVTLKERNPANKANNKDIKALKALENSPNFIIEDKSSFTYYKALRIKKQVCLKCHGDISKNTKLSKYILKTYPNDKATHYKMGDLRGAVVVEFLK